MQELDTQSMMHKDDVKFYEAGGSPLGEFKKQFEEYWLSGINDPRSDADHDGDTTDIVYVTYEPKVKWFKPPFSITIWKWEISFMWAYKVHKVYTLKDCYPTGCTASMGDQNEVEIQFKCNKFDDDKITDVAEKLKSNFTKMENIDE